jgi:hypothetical protein
MMQGIIVGRETCAKTRHSKVRLASALPHWRFWIFLAFIVCSRPQITRAQVLLANFDDLTIGFVGKSFTDGGVTFSNLDMRGYPSKTFAVQTAFDVTPGFSSPNYLIFGGYSPEPGFLLARFGSMDITFSGEATAATIYILAQPTPNFLTLQALQYGKVVASETLPASSASPDFTPLTVSGEFDRLRLVAAGDYNNGAIFMGVDNLSVTLIPEPHINELIGACVTSVALAYAAGRSKPLVRLFPREAVRQERTSHV